MKDKNRILILDTDKPLSFYKIVYLGVVLRQQAIAVTDLERQKGSRGDQPPMVVLETDLHKHCQTRRR